MPVSARSIHDPTAVEEFRRRWRLDPAVVRRLRNALYKGRGDWSQLLGELPTAMQADLITALPWRFLSTVSRHDSADDGASKLIFRTAAGLQLESVILRIVSGRTSLCVSSQVGCAVRCAFCATGKMGLVRNLSRDEILDQLLLANQLLLPEQRRVRNVVFMGMGEPFHNEEAVLGAIEVLTSPQCFQLSGRHITVSTIGIPDGMLRLARRFPQVRQAVSLHSARAAAREQLIPLAARYPLHELRAAVKAVAEITGQTVMVEYLLLCDTTDRAADLQALADWLRDLPVHVNLMPYNAIADAPELHGVDRSRAQEIAAWLRGQGHQVTIRYSLGLDVAAACGQLIRERPVALRAVNTH